MGIFSMPHGLSVATAHGPFAAALVNQTPLSNAKYLPTESFKTVIFEFSARSSEVPSMGLNWGEPSNNTFTFAVLRSTFAVCGISASMIASSAALVPEILANTTSFADPSGILAKSAGILSGSLNIHGPAREDDLNQRPAIRI